MRRNRLIAGGGGLIVPPLGSLNVGDDTFAFEGEGGGYDESTTSTRVVMTSPDERRRS